MNIHQVFKRKLLITLIVALLAGLHILWDYSHGSIPTHYLLASDDLPGFSNLWGLLTLPMLTWGIITVTERRVSVHELLHPERKKGSSEILLGFFSAFVFGLTMSVFWEFQLQEILQYLILLPVAIAFIKPVHFPEYLLGFVLAMVFTFGGVLPILFGTVVLLMCFVAHMISRGILWFISKIKG
jgi:hypothetical protein